MLLHQLPPLTAVEVVKRPSSVIKSPYVADVRFPDGSIGEYLVGDDGSFNITSTAPQASGQVTAIAFYEGTADTSPSTTALYSTGYLDNLGQIQNVNSGDAATDDPTPGLNVGRLPANTTFSLYVDGIKVNATYDPTMSTLTPDVALTDGPHDLTYTQTNAKGQESVQSLPLSVTIDTIPPAAPTLARPGATVGAWVGN